MMRAIHMFVGISMGILLLSKVSQGVWNPHEVTSDRSSKREMMRETRTPLLVCFLYLLVRRFFARECHDLAHENARRVIKLEQRSGVFFEAKLQRWLTEHALWLVKAANSLYITGYFGLLALAYMFFYRTGSDKPKSDRYWIFKRSFALCASSAMLVFGLLPTAPPRKMTSFGFVDADRSHGFNLINNKTFLNFFNEYAAMPSLHFGWAILVGITAMRYNNMNVRLSGLLYPCFTAFLVLVTGHHYFLDLVSGGIVAGLAYGVATLWSRTCQSRRRYR